MFLNNWILFYTLLVGAGCVAIYFIARMMHVRVWINKRLKKGEGLLNIGYLDFAKDGKAALVHLIGGIRTPIGRVILDDENDKALVEVLTSDLDEDPDKLVFKTAGYVSIDVDSKGYIYKIRKGRKAEVIGYTARPSAPNVPCIKGERTWRTLWLKKTLWAFEGMPKEEVPETENVPEKKPATPIPEQKVPEPVPETGEKPADKTPAPNEGTPAPDTDPNHTPADTAPEEEATANAAPDQESKEAPVNSEKNNGYQAFVTFNGLDDEPLSEDLGETAEKQNSENEEVPAEETPAEETPAEETPAEETPAEVTPAEVTPAEATPAEVTPADPFASFTDKEKKYLDNVKRTYPKLLNQIISDMVEVKGGTFLMGDDPKENTITDEDGNSRGAVEQNESPKHSVTLDNYYISRYPVTQSQWKAIMGYNPSDSQDNPKFPVAPVTWNQCQDFLLRLHYITGIQFYLPTEAQWEFAARGGNRSKGYIFSGGNTFSEVGFKDYKNEVGKKKPNELGLYDMSGLVREWCSDFYGHYTEEAQTNPTGPAEDSELIMLSQDGRICRVVRSPYGNETVTNRKGEEPDLNKQFKSYGLRIACYTLPEKVEPAPPVKPVAPAPKPNSSTPNKEDKDKVACPAAICNYWGFTLFNSGGLVPAEARACAYALFHDTKRKGYKESYQNSPYGWLDTALLTSFIYSILFLILYIFNTGVLRLPLLGEDFIAVILLFAFYFLLWIIVRAFKIDRTEDSDSFQPQLDLFNKRLGERFTDWAIIAFCALATYFTFYYYDYDLIPLIWAIAFGVGLNMLVQEANRPWKIQTSLVDLDNDDDDEDEEIINPAGDIDKEYEWSLDKNLGSLKRVKGNLTLHFSQSEINVLRHNNPFYLQRKEKDSKEYVLDMFHTMKEHKSFMRRILYVGHYIEDVTKKQDLLETEKLQFTLDFVQEPNILYMPNEKSRSTSVMNYRDYIRYPDETLFDKEGDCNSKALLAAMLFHAMRYDVLFLYSQKQQHSAIGIALNEEIISRLPQNLIDKGAFEFEFNGFNKRYLYCETVGDNMILGNLYNGFDILDFDEKILLPYNEENPEEIPDTSNSETRTYEWQLDSENQEHKLNCSYVLEMNAEDIEKLRKANPFAAAGGTGVSTQQFEQNIRNMFGYLCEDSSRLQYVQAIADEIDRNCKEANLPDLDRAQLALDFCQAPNITYRKDDESRPINFAQEYMRFPDEVLFDKEGDCDCKSSLTAALFHCLGYNVILMLSDKLGHAAIGIESHEEWYDFANFDDLENVLLDHNGRQYLYCETTGDGYRIGHIKEGDSIHDFETIIDIPV